MVNTDVKVEVNNRTMIVYLSGEIDHHTAEKIRSKIDMKIEGVQPSLLILDFTNINFMDSSGIGFIMGRYKFMKDIGGILKITNPSPQIKKVMKLAGFDRLAIIEKRTPSERGDFS